MLWQRNGMGTGVGFAVGDDKLFVGTQETSLAFDLETGHLLWSASGQGRFAQAPLYDTINKLVVLDQADYWLLDPNDGKLVLQFPGRPQQGFPNFNKGFIDKGLLFYEDGVIDVMANRVLHPQSNRGTQFGRSILVGNYLLLNVMEGIVALDSRNYTEVWQYDTSSVDNQRLAVVAGPVVLNNKIYILLSNAALLGLDVNTGRELGSWQGQQVVDQLGRSTPLRPGLEVGGEMLFATFGTKELCGFGSKP